jgi:hypothetical protein
MGLAWRVASWLGLARRLASLGLAAPLLDRPLGLPPLRLVTIAFIAFARVAV